MKVELVGSISNVEVIAAGAGIRVRTYLRKAYGGVKWRKMKGTATVRLERCSALGGVTLV